MKIDNPRPKCRRGLMLALALLAMSGCAGAQGNTYSVVSQKMVGGSEPAPAPTPAAGSQTSGAQSQTASGAEGEKSDNLVGVWEGTTRASCEAVMPFPDRCNAQENVKMTLLRGDDAKLIGHYKCSYGNMDCFHLNETGRIVEASLNGRQVSMLVMLPDATSCRFMGHTAENNDVDGGYSCYSGGALIEQGTWHARRSY